MNLSGKVAIVTGASRGIGAQVALQLAKSGAKVVVNYASSRAKAEEVVTNIGQAGGEAAALQADVAVVTDIAKLFAQTLAHFGRVDILVNNAGVMECLPLAQVTEASFDRQFATNVKGTYFACQQALAFLPQDERLRPPGRTRGHRQRR